MISINDYLDCFDASFKMIPNQIIRLQESQGVKQFAAYPVNEKEDDLYHFSSSPASTSSTAQQTSSPITTSDDTHSPSSLVTIKAADSSSMEDDSSNINKNKGSKYYVDVAPVPLETVTKAAIMMVLDENHFIRELHVEYRCVSETPYSGLN
eukprot:gene211-221_t